MFFNKYTPSVEAEVRLVSVRNKLRQDKAKGILIIPVWKSAPYWPIIQKKDIFHEFIKDIHYLPQQDCIITGDGKNGVFADNPLKFKMVALRIVC
jgi:hypothetical protein